MEQVKVLRGTEALKIIEEMLDNNYVLTPDYRLVYLKPGDILVKKTSACGPTSTGRMGPIVFETLKPRTI